MRREMWSAGAKPPPSPHHRLIGAEWVLDDAAKLADERACMIVWLAQARVALRQAGRLAAVDKAVAATGDAVLIEAWTSAATVRRLIPAVQAITANLSPPMTSTELGDLFRATMALDLWSLSTSDFTSRSATKGRCRKSLVIELALLL